MSGDMRITALMDGGFIVFNGDVELHSFNPPRKACSTLAEALKYLHEQMSPKPPTLPPVRDGYPSKIEWIKDYRARAGVPLKEALHAYDCGRPMPEGSAA